ncbi:hypothetical protein [Capillimicrobium parvum]|uniref:hypothetical protein n=1 Tax=Capillimicrobium parvum TaxID=2884022 RepID=UPI00216B465B|nr:hypothetical protein [Capillimicrobium parvum]
MTASTPTPTPTPPPAPEPSAAPPLAQRIEALWSRRLGWALVAVAVLGALVVFAARETYPNYDTYYTLLWGQEIFHGHLPDYHVLRPPTPHPLATFVGWLLAPFGTSSDRLLVLVSLLLFVALLVILFRFTQRLLGSLVALIAVVVVLTRTDIDLLALRSMFDLPFYVLVFGAAALELRRPRCGWPVLGLLALAGLLRPEAWLLGGVYWLWLIPVTPRPQLIRLAVLVVVAPVLWLLSDLIVEGQPLYSLTETRDVAGQFGRQRGLGEAIRLIPDHVSGNDKIVIVGLGGLGLLEAIYILRRRAALPVALGALGVLTFLIIAAAGLSAIPRYLTIPSLLLSLCVAVALGGWTLIADRRVRAVGIALAIVSLVVIAWRAPSYRKDVSVLNHQAQFVSKQHQSLFAVLDDPRVVALMQTCRPLIVPTHSTIPIIRYETGLSKHAIQATIAQKEAPPVGLLFVNKTFNFEPGAARSALGGRSRSRQWWSNRKLPGYEKVARHGKWTVYQNCP